MHDPSKLIVAIVAILAVTYSIRTYIAAAFPGRRNVGGKDSVTPAADARLSRLEQAVDAIALFICDEKRADQKSSKCIVRMA